ncbi:hypothetical protein BASA50_002772 [Batrachochytrium salamandrivorans]|uniref:Basal body-orientation factor 1 n=1 Tax=Batrachochytrium salamandrivorans TaxID=1357716 RepID=A0ABQ8FN98_9FUNG|nr:hypothetical protein BASA61_009592 [Batrachochytrium salamandrivorans]KAH6582761.1 hypothetical protein BASA60_001773 [Batrachochytrium salamandrivorans]KAH6599747.1 hypothetical protein BASA50_002772 [Batrachochytrium salamandrivorans]
MSTTGSVSMNEEGAVMSVVSKKNSKTKKKSKKTSKSKAPRQPKDMVVNDNGELVTTREYTLEKMLGAATKSLKQIQDRVQSLVHTNETLSETCQQQEKDALEVIAALHQECESKDKKYKELQESMEEKDRLAQQAIDAVIDESNKKLAEINKVLNEKEAVFKIMQQEFSVIKDFRKKRTEMLRDLDEQKAELIDTEKRHKDIITRIERKFFEEKIRLQKEANRNISELATKAHKEAIMNLNETTKEVYKENIRISEALQYHVQEREELNKANSELVYTNRQLAEEKDLNNVVIKEKIIQTKNQEKEIKDLKLKITSMENSLLHVVKEFDCERTIFTNSTRDEIDSVRKVVDKLKSSLTCKTLEMKHIKRLAQHILEQRTELEQFFLEALEMTKKEMQKAKEKQLKEVRVEYDKKMRTAFKDKASIPPVRSFRFSQKSTCVEPLPTILANNGNQQTTNMDSNSKLDIKDLTWEDKERVLRILFAKMNNISLTKATDVAEHPHPKLSQRQKGGGIADKNGFTRDINQEIDIESSNATDEALQSIIDMSSIDSFEPEIKPLAEEGGIFTNSDQDMGIFLSLEPVHSVQ